MSQAQYDLRQDVEAEEIDFGGLPPLEPLAPLAPELVIPCVDYLVQFTTTFRMLGSVPYDKELYQTYILSKHPGRAADEEGVEPLDAEQVGDDELETVQDIVAKRGWTGFHMLAGQPILYDYVINGFAKEACAALRQVKADTKTGMKGTLSSKFTAFKKKIDGLCFPYPRRILLIPPRPIEGDFPVDERPLRAETAQGPRVALAASDYLLPGTRWQVWIRILGNQIPRELLEEWLYYGQYKGFGQWRNSGRGRVSYEIRDVVYHGFTNNGQS